MGSMCGGHHAHHNCRVPRCRRDSTHRGIVLCAQSRSLGRKVMAGIFRWWRVDAGEVKGFPVRPLVLHNSISACSVSF